METINLLYSYCTEFVLNVANLTGTSYYEVNFVLFCVLYPLLLLGLPLLVWRQKRKLRKLEQNF